MEEAKGDQIPRTLKKDDRLNTGGYKTLSMTGNKTNAEEQEVNEPLGNILDRQVTEQEEAGTGAAAEWGLPQESETGSSKDKRLCL